MLHILLNFWHWYQEVTGTNNGIPGHTPRWYNFFSAMGEFTVIALVLNYYRTHKCERCWRISKHDVHGTHYSTCHNHFTEADHELLKAKHKRKFPLQHAFHVKHAAQAKELELVAVAVGRTKTH